MATRKNRREKPKKKAVLEEKRSKPKSMSLKKQFDGLDMNDPGQWPAAPQFVACVFIAVVVVVMAWFLILNGQYSNYEQAQAEELSLKDDFLRKWRIAANLEAMQKKQAQVETYVTQLEAKLPSEAQLDSLLRDVNSAAERNYLNVVTLRAQDVVTREYYVEQPIEVLITGKSYHDFGRFAESLAALERIITMGDVVLEPIDPKLGEASGVRLKSVLRTYRYMSDSERAAVNQPPQVR